MASTSETGIATNIANLKTMIGFTVSYGDKYKPSNELLTTENLQKLEVDIEKSVGAYDKLEGELTKLQNDRTTEFDNLDPLVTEIVNAFDSCGVSKLAVDNAMEYVRLIRGDSKKKKPTPEEIEAMKAAGKEYKPHSTSQLSYVNRVSNFGKLIDVLEPEPKYTPNETELKIDTLKAYKQTLTDLNQGVADKKVKLADLKIIRDNLFNNPENGLVFLSVRVKNYVKSVYGANTNRYQDVAALKFTKVR